MTQPTSPEPDGRPDFTKHAPPAAPAPRGYGPPPGYGPPAPQGYGPPQGFPPPQGYTGPQGYGPPPGYGPPAPQGYGPPQGFGPPPGYGPAPLVGPYSPLVGRLLTSDEKTWGMLAHLGGLLFGFLAPLVVMLAKGPESPYTRAQAVEALNFQITLGIAYLVSAIAIIVLIGLVMLPVVAVVHLVLGILASVAANRGELYRYPVSIRMVS